MEWGARPPERTGRADLHAIEDLVAAGAVYACDCTAEDVQTRNKAAGGKPGYDGHCRERSGPLCVNYSSEEARRGAMHKSCGLFSAQEAASPSAVALASALRPTEG